MEYSINNLSKIAGVSTRTLRYYDEIGLLKPCRITSSKYRIYGEEEIDTLQQIMFFRELGVSLEEIKILITDSSFDKSGALENHLEELIQKRVQLDTLIKNVSKTIKTIKGEATMTTKEKFEGFKEKAIKENEEKYGKEVKEKYGESTVEASNKKFKNMTKEDHDKVQALSMEINETLKMAFEKGDVASELAKKTVELHKQWLGFYWPQGLYSPESHIGLGKMYVEDERFKKYYDDIVFGSAEFLRDAIIEYYKDKK